MTKFAITQFNSIIRVTVILKIWMHEILCLSETTFYFEYKGSSGVIWLLLLQNNNEIGKMPYINLWRHLHNLSYPKLAYCFWARKECSAECTPIFDILLPYCVFGTRIDGYVKWMVTWIFRCSRQENMQQEMYLIMEKLYLDHIIIATT